MHVYPPIYIRYFGFDEDDWTLDAALREQNVPGFLRERKLFVPCAVSLGPAEIRWEGKDRTVTNVFPAPRWS
jgi:hypothetical protein